MLAQLRPALALFVVLSIITGVVYPLAITGIAQIGFHDKANGSLVVDGAGRPIGSALIGQDFASSPTGNVKDAARWFWGRPSATSPVAYTALNLDKSAGSSGSNLAPTNAALLANIKARIDALHAAEAAVGVARAASSIPVEFVTCSGSGLDPHISPASAEYQIPRVAKARGLSEDAVRDLVRAHTTARTLGLLGEPVVNVLELNVALNQPAR